MQRVIIVTVLLLFIPLIGLTQEPEDFRYLDSLTYKLYLDGNWKLLTSMASESIRRGIDYYYMRMRLGISYYERKNYLAAITHFKHALEYNEEDPVALEYLYYCYLLSGNESNSRVIRTSFNNSLKEKISASESKTAISTDYLRSATRSDWLITDKESIEGFGQAGTIVVPRSFTNFSFSLALPLSPGASLYQSATVLRKTNYFYYNDGTYQAEIPQQNVQQYQYWASISFANDNGLVVSPSFHFLNIRYPLIYFSTVGPFTSPETYKHIENNFVAGINLCKLAGLFEIQIAGHFLYLNTKQHFQGTGGLLIYPSGNGNFYLGIQYSPIVSESGSGWDYRNVSRLVAGLGISSRVWIELSGLSGDVSNFSYRNGYILYNGAETIDRVANVDITIPLGLKGSKIYFGSGYSRQYCTWLPEPGIREADMSNKLNSMKIYGGLSWVF